MASDTNIGPVTTPAQYKKILDYIDIAKAEGARCLLGGKPATGAGIKVEDQWPLFGISGALIVAAVQSVLINRFVPATESNPELAHTG